MIELRQATDADLARIYGNNAFIGIVAMGGARYDSLYGTGRSGTSLPAWRTTASYG